MRHGRQNKGKEETDGWKGKERYRGLLQGRMAGTMKEMKKQMDGRERRGIEKDKREGWQEG